MPHDFQNVPERLEPAVKAGAEFLIRELARLANHPANAIYLYGGYDLLAGLTLSEITFASPDGRGGSSFMACDMPGFPVLAAAREVLVQAQIEPYRPEGWESDVDVRAEAVEMLEYWWKEGETA